MEEVPQVQQARGWAWLRRFLNEIDATKWQADIVMAYVTQGNSTKFPGQK